MQIDPVFRKKSNDPMTIGIFLSGTGSNFDAIARYLVDNKINDTSINFVFSNVPDCPGIKNAENYGFNTYTLSSKTFLSDLGQTPDNEESRILYDREVLNLLSGHINTDLIVLAGYRRKFSSLFYDSFSNKMINMYPGDITRDYLVKGIPASLQAIRNNDKDIRCTVYIDRKDVRFGSAILQSEPIPLEAYNEQNISVLDKNIRENAEWIALPHAIFEIIAKERLSIDKNGRLYLDNNLLPENGIQL